MEKIKQDKIYSGKGKVAERTSLAGVKMGGKDLEQEEQFGGYWRAPGEWQWWLG